MFGWRGWLLGERQASKVKKSSYNDRRAVYVIQMYLQIGMIWIYGYNMKGDLCPHWIREPGDDAGLWGARISTAEVEKQGSLDPSRTARDISEVSCLRLRAASHFHMSISKFANFWDRDEKCHCTHPNTVCKASCHVHAAVHRPSAHRQWLHPTRQSSASSSTPAS